MPRSRAYRIVTAVDSGTALASRSTQMFLRSSTNGTTLTVLTASANGCSPSSSGEKSAAAVSLSQRPRTGSSQIADVVRVLAPPSASIDDPDGGRVAINQLGELLFPVPHASLTVARSRPERAPCALNR